MDAYFVFFSISISLWNDSAFKFKLIRLEIFVSSSFCFHFSIIHCSANFGLDLDTDLSRIISRIASWISKLDGDSLVADTSHETESFKKK